MSFEVSLKEAVIRGGYTAPTCRLCHIEYRGQFSHNLVHWDFNPTPAIADNLDHPWFRERLDAWVGTDSHLIKLYKGLVHANPGGFTYSEGWSPLLRDYAEIMDENARLREKGRVRRAALAEIVNLAGADLRLYRLQ